MTSSVAEAREAVLDELSEYGTYGRGWDGYDGCEFSDTLLLRVGRVAKRFPVTREDRKRQSG